MQAAVYEEFSRHIPGFKPLTDKELVAVMTTTTATAATAPKANGSEVTTVVASGGQQATTAPLTASEESWAILDEVHNKLQPFVEQCTSKLCCTNCSPLLNNAQVSYVGTFVYTVTSFYHWKGTDTQFLNTGT